MHYKKMEDNFGIKV